MTEHTAPGRPPVRSYLRFLAVAAVVAALLAAVGWSPTRNLAGIPGVRALLVACALCWLASALGGVPVLVAEIEMRRQGARRQAPLSVLLGSALTRFAAIVGLALAAALSGLLAPAPLLVWVAIGYLALLAVDTWYAFGATRHGS